jgi:hypothetical protein
MSRFLNSAPRLVILSVSAACLIGGVRVLAEETSVSLSGALGSTTLSGYVDTSATWSFEAPLPSPSPVPEPSPMLLAVLGSLALGGWWMRSRRR